MYVEERAGFDVDTDPYAGMFGQIRNGGIIGGGAPVLDSGGGYLDPFYGLGQEVLQSNPFESSGISEDRLISLLVPCGGWAIADPGRAADCAWDALRGVIEASDDLLAILTTIAYSDCAAALSALGLPSAVMSAVCSIPSVGAVWTAFQNRARTELNRIESEGAAARREADYARGRDRTPAEGGGHTLVGEDGVETAVACPGFVEQVTYGPDGKPSVLRMGSPGIYPAGARCPEGVAIRQDASSSTTIIQARRPAAFKAPARLPFQRPEGYKSGASAPWYKNKWLWIGGAVALAGGTAAVVALRRRR